MALDQTKLTKMAGGGDNSIWYYRTPDLIATLTSAGYFNAATVNLKQFDIINSVTNTGVAASAVVEPLLVTSATGAAVVVVSATEGVP
jgi:orotate phosphoribosyltransferase-like protein